jgi:hypothetical protein
MRVFMIVSLSHFIHLSNIHFHRSCGVAVHSVISLLLSIVTFAGFINPCSWRVCGSLPVVYPASFFNPTPATGSIAENTEPIATLLGEISHLLAMSYPAVSTPQIAQYFADFSHKFVALAHNVLPFANCPTFHS